MVATTSGFGQPRCVSACIYKGCGEGWENDGDVAVARHSCSCSCAVYFFAKGFHHGGSMAVVTTVNGISQGG